MNDAGSWSVFTMTDEEDDEDEKAAILRSALCVIVPRLHRVVRLLLVNLPVYPVWLSLNAAIAADRNAAQPQPPGRQQLYAVPARDATGRSYMSEQQQTGDLA